MNGDAGKIWKEVIVL